MTKFKCLNFSCSSKGWAFINTLPDISPRHCVNVFVYLSALIMPSSVKGELITSFDTSRCEQSVCVDRSWSASLYELTTSLFIVLPSLENIRNDVFFAR
ncbi:hypothetical protein D3C80_1821280 [compost metagenome]